MTVNRIEYFVLRERATKFLLPHMKVQTRAEFADKGPPRLFTSRNAASNTLNCWRMGYWVHKVDSYGDSEGPMPSEWKGNIEIAARRAATEVDIVPMQLISA